MITVDKVRLKNVVTYRDQEFKFEPGLTLVKGENRAGKSLLFSSLANLLYFSHPLADKKDAKAILTAKEEDVEDTKTKKTESSSITLDIKKDDSHLYSIKQKASKESVTYQIQENGIDLDSRTIALSKDLIEGIFSQPEDIFYTSTYLTSYRNHPLLHGSTAQRYEFFEKLFNFEFFDFLYEKFNLELKDLENKKAELTNLESLLLELPTKQLELEKHTKDLEAVQSRRDVLQSNLGLLTQLRMEVIRLLDVQGDLTRVRGILKSLQSSEGATFAGGVTLATIEKEIEELEKTYATLIEVEKNNRLVQSKELEVKASKVKRDEIVEAFRVKEDQFKLSLGKLDMVVEGVDVGSLQNDITSAQGTILGLQQKLQGKTLDQWANIYSKTNELKDLTASSLNLSLGDVEKFTEETCNDIIRKLQGELASITFSCTDTHTKFEKINKLANHKSSDTHDKINCPTCLSDLSVEQIATYKQELEASLEGFKVVQAKLEGDLVAYNRYAKCLNFMASAPSLSEVEEILEAIRGSEVRLSLVKDILVSYNTYNDAKKNKDIIVSNTEALEKQYQELLGITSDFVVGDSESIRKQIDTLKTLNKALHDQRLVEVKVMSKIKEIEGLVASNLYLQEIPSFILSTDNLEDILPKLKLYLEDKINQHTTENTGMQTTLTNASVAVGFLRKEIVQLEQHKAKVVGLKSDLQQYDTVTRLAKIFHTKGFRLEKIKYFTQVFESTLNRYSGFLFMEPFSFSISVEKRDLQILASRAGKQSDVRYLSGSESRCFQLLCLISILSLLPSSKRANICILDEMDAGCDESTTQMFYEKFLPELRAIVPSVVVISPLKDNGYYINEDRAYMIRKVAGISEAQLLIK